MEFMFDKFRRSGEEDDITKFIMLLWDMSFNTVEVL
jgi:hypothetical protein